MGIISDDPQGDAGMDGVQEQFRGETDDEDAHMELHIYEGDSAFVVRENGNKSLYGVQLPELMALFNDARTADGPEPVAVKALEWRYYAGAFPTAWDAETPWGRYSVEERWGPNVEPLDWHQDVDSKWALSFGVQLVGVYASLDAAKVAAQADFERHIRSAITHPVPVDGPAETHSDGRKKGHSKLVYNKQTRTIDKVDPHGADGPADAVSEAEVEAALGAWRAAPGLGVNKAIMRICLQAAQRARK